MKTVTKETMTRLAKWRNELDDHERALRELKARGYDRLRTIPMHTANMRMLDDEGHDVVKPVIVPAVDAMAQKVKDGQVSKHHIYYRLAYYRCTFPLSHVFNNSGHLCLGTIFVPDKVPVHACMQPLETLLLYNDRVYAHGNPQLLVKIKQAEEVIALLSEHNITLSETLQRVLVLSDNWVIDDAFWRLSNVILTEAKNKETAYQCFKQVLDILYGKVEIND